MTIAPVPDLDDDGYLSAPPPIPTPSRNGNGAQPTRPTDLDAERGILATALLWSDAADTAALVDPNAWSQPRHANIAHAIGALHGRGEPVDAITTRIELERIGVADSLTEQIVLELALGDHQATRAGAHKYAQRVNALHHQWITHLRLRDAARHAGEGDIATATELASQVAAGHVPGQTTRPATLAEFLANEDDAHDWIIPDLLEAGDRLLLTGPEGGGKSTLLRQIAIQAASGIHPFTYDQIEPLRVLLLDLENSVRQVRRALRPLHLASDMAAGDTLHVECIPEGLDLTDHTDVTRLAQLIDSTAAQLVIGGPVYKLVGGDPTEEGPAKAAAIAIDRLRARYGVAVALETHQPHGSEGKRPERPYGASLWKRWPEFGLHLSEEGHLRHWRGDRDQREWPAALQRGGTWPWMVAARQQDQSYARIVECVTNAGRKLSIRDIESRTSIPRSTVERALQNNRNHYDKLVASIEMEAP